MSRRKKTKYNRPVRDIEFELSINEVSRGGAGVGQDENGRAVFVPFTLIGDVVKVRLKNCKQRYAEAELIEIITSSEQRQAPKCPVFTQCGGCQWQHLSYTLQWDTKCAGVAESLRQAGVKYKAEWDQFPAEQVWEYRNRIQLRRKDTQIGFYSKQSHQLVPIQQCFIARAEINQRIADIHQEMSNSENNYTLNGKFELALSEQNDVLDISSSQPSVAGFRQVNDEQNNNLQSWIKQQLIDAEGIFDLYGGLGNLSLGLTEAVIQIHCVDTYIAKGSKIYPDNIDFHEVAVSNWLESRYEQQKYARKNTAGPNTWMAILDPPRSGLDKNGDVIIKYLTMLNVSKVVLVGCKPDPWSRDVAKFLSKGWRLEKVAIFDFFPQTYHVESAAVLVRH